VHKFVNLTWQDPILKCKKYMHIYRILKFTCENITNIQLANGQLHESSKALRDSNFVVTRMIIYY
jgi:hypothetical protein